jgi:hypothetical protein
VTVTHVTRTLAVDGAGNPVRDAQGNDTYVETSTDIDDATVWPRTGSENPQAGDLVITGRNLLLPPGVTVAATDQFIVAGLTYDVDGDAGDWTSPFTGWNPGTQIALTQVTG